MEVVQFIYNEQTIDFQPEGRNNVMVNATQMAKVFGKRIDFFLKSDHANEFIKELEFTPFGGNSAPLKREEIIITRGQSGTWMHRILALKFAAWLDTKFELWVFTTIDQIILGHYKEVRSASEEKIIAEQKLMAKKCVFLESNPEYAEILELEAIVNAADRRRLKALKEDMRQLKLDLFPETLKS